MQMRCHTNLPNHEVEEGEIIMNLQEKFATLPPEIVAGAAPLPNQELENVAGGHPKAGPKLAPLETWCAWCIFDGKQGQPGNDRCDECADSYKKGITSRPGSDRPKGFKNESFGK
jgi:hypothetical protein